MTADDILDFGADHVVLATGSRWRRDGIGSHGEMPAGMRATMPAIADARRYRRRRRIAGPGGHL